jgi:predicted NAD/FAD-binding protein
VVDGGGAEGRFDHVILASHADQALRMLQSPSQRETELLKAFPYEPNNAVLHTDTAVLPKKRLAWASWNYHVRRDDPDRAAVTYNMNLLQSLAPKPVFNVTLNDDDGIDEAKVVRRIRYEHPVFTSRRKESQQSHGELIGANRTSFCGAYWGYGFHEDGVNSALRVCRVLEQELAA